MPDVQVLATGTQAPPLDYLVKDAQEIIPRLCYAHFDGTGAAGAFIPTLQIISDSGHTVGEIPMDASVAAGSSVEASWGPFLRGAAAAAPAPSKMVYGYAFRNAWTWPQPGSTLADFTGGTFFTSDATVLSTNAANTVPLRVEAAGLYLVEIGVGEWQTAWGNVANISLGGIVSWKYNTDASTPKRPQMAPTYTPVVGTHPYLTTTIVAVIESAVIPANLSISAIQQSGANRTVNVQMFATRLSTL